MVDHTVNFQSEVKRIANLNSNQGFRECYGMSNCAKFVKGGFLCGIPNLDSLNQASGPLCVFSKIQLSPRSELHTAIVFREDFPALLAKLKAMVDTPSDFFADKNNNCAIFISADSKAYAYNKAKVTFELTSDVLEKIGPGIEPDALYWAVYGDEVEADGGVIQQLEKLVGNEKFRRIAEPPQRTKTDPMTGAELSIDSLVADFVTSCREASIETSVELVQRYLASLMAKRFVILSGLAGSGKTKLAQFFSRWISDAPGSYAIVPVGADWSGNENILGYPDGLQSTKYILKPALALLLRAESHPKVPHFLILDEMNMSHVERYFADILSAIESDEGIELYECDMDATEKWRKTSADALVPPALKRIPNNFFIVGTVNVDETTYMFSPKVLDRANVIEFRVNTNEFQRFLKNPAKPNLSSIDGKGSPFGNALVDLTNAQVAVPSEVKHDYDAEMTNFFQVLQSNGAEFGYRTAYEAARFVYFCKLLGNYKDDELGWFSTAFDCVVFQKLLPKLHGSRAKLGPILKKLWFLCVNDSAIRGMDTLNAAEEAARSSDKIAEPNIVVPPGAPYPMSAEKIGRMWRLLVENGFASFAEA